MKYSILIILAILIHRLEAQEIRPEINILAQKIAEYNILQSEQAGIADEPTVQYRNFLKLKDKAMTNELLELLKHNNPVVKGYSSWALADRMYFSLSEILASFLENMDSAYIQHTYMAEKGDLATEFYYRIFHQQYYNHLSATDSLFFQFQIEQLDSVILYENRDNPLMYSALTNNNANPNHYARIRELAELNKTKLSLVALARYRNNNDISFFKEQGTNSFRAISVFPDREFWDFLLEYKLKEKSLDFFYAISSYKNDSALEVLNGIYEDCNPIQVNHLVEALIINYCDLYQDLILRIWENNKAIDLTITQQLIADCPEKASLSFAKGLLSIGEYNFLEINQNYGTRDSIMPLMLSHVSEHNNCLVIDICKHNITNSKFKELSTILNFISEHQIIETTPEILDRLSKRNSPYETYNLAITLLSFGDINANLELVEALRSNKNHWDIGNWSEHFRKLFKEYNVKIE